MRQIKIETSYIVSGGIDSHKRAEESKNMKVRLNGREYDVLATFPDTFTGTHAANEYMEANEGASLLVIENGKLYIADSKDKGTPVKPQTQK